jgi:hypothetical protein
MLMASIFRWSYLPPTAVGNAHGFADVDTVIQLKSLAPVPRLLIGGAVQEWSEFGLCPPGWHVVLLNETRYTGFDRFAEARDKVLSKLSTARNQGAKEICVVTAQGFRFQLHQAHAWESAGHIRKGVFATVTGAMRRALRPKSAAVPTIGSVSPHLPRIGRLAVHARRGDKEQKGSGHSSALRHPLYLLRMAIILGARAMAATELFPGGISVELYTDAANSTSAGCPSSSELPEGVLCRVAAGSVLSDLHGLVTSDVLMMSVSSFSILAFMLREGERAGQPTLVPVERVSQFFVDFQPPPRECIVLASAVDGIPSSNDGAERPRKKGDCFGRREPPLAPHHVLFIHHTALRMALAAPTLAPLLSKIQRQYLTSNPGHADRGELRDAPVRLGSKLRQLLVASHLKTIWLRSATGRGS